MMWLWAAAILGLTAVEHVHVMTGDGSEDHDVTVVWDHGHIVSVGHQPAPKGSERVDGTGKILTPGLVEVRTRLGLSEIDQEESTNDFALRGAIFTPAFNAADGLNESSVRMAVVRSEGITSVVTAPGGQVIYGTGAWYDVSATSPGQAYQPLAMFGGVGSDAAAACGGARGGVWLSLRELFEDARFYVKNVAAIDHGQARPLVARTTHLRAMGPVIAGKMPLVLHADRADDIARAVEFAQSQGIKLIIEGGGEAWRVREVLAKAKVPVVTRPSVAQPDSFETLRARREAAKLLSDAGVTVVLSAGYVNQDIVRLRQEAGAAVAYGWSHAKALQSITLAPASIFGKDHEVGSIAPGKRANLVLWSGDPFETRTQAEAVWVGGERQPTLTRQRRLAQRYLH